MLILLFIIIFVAAAGSLVAYLVRPSLRQLPGYGRRNFDPSLHRPLFEPDKEELRSLADAEEKKLDAAEREKRREAAAIKIAEFETFRERWSTEPNRSRTIELLYLASQTEIGDIYLETAKQVIEKWRSGPIGGLELDDLAQLVESHFWLLPANERSSGSKFILQDEIAALRKETGR